MDRKKSILFIVNPISGSGKYAPIEESIKKYLNQQLYDYEVEHTLYAGHAADLTVEATRRGIDVIVAVGGDGTVNEVARSIIHTPSALGIIPRGSGNGLARHLQIPTNTRKAIEILNRHTLRSLDYGLMNGHPFFCTCGVGFDAFVSHKFASAGKRGFLTYAENTLREGLRYKPETYTIEDETGTIIHQAFLIACANASQYGNNAYIAPDASMEDGLMDVVVMKPFNTLVESPLVLLQMFTKTLPENPNVEVFKSKKIRILRNSEGAVHLDGEPLEMGQEIVVEMVRARLNAIVNPKALAPKYNLLNDITDSLNDLKKRMEAGARQMEESEMRVKNSIAEFKKKVDRGWPWTQAAEKKTDTGRDDSTKSKEKQKT